MSAPQSSLLPAPSSVRLLLAALLAAAATATASQGPAADPRQRALEAFQGGDLERAQSLAAGWVAEHPEDAAVQFLLGMTRVSLGEQMERGGRPRAEVLAVYSGALDALLAAERLAPEGALHGVDHAVAHILLAQGHPAEAVTRLDRAIEKSPEHPALHALRGEAFLRMGRSESAALDLEEGVRRNPDDTGIRLLYAQALFRSGRDADARQTLEEFYDRIRDQPPDERHWQVQFEISRYAGNDLEVARHALEEARRVDPARGEGRLRLGILYYRLGEHAAARDELEAALASGQLTDPQRAEALHHQGLLASHAGDHEAARRLFDEALALAPNSAQILKNQAATLRRLGDPGADRMLERFREVVGLENDTRRLRDSLMVMPDDRSAHVDLVRHLLDLGQLDEAGMWLDTLRGRFPGDPSIPELEARLRAVRQ